MSWEEAKQLIEIANATLPDEIFAGDRRRIDKFTTDFSNMILAANQVRDMELPGTAEFMVTAQCEGYMEIGIALDWNNGPVQHIAKTKADAIKCAQLAIETWAAAGMPNDLEIDIMEGPEEFLIDDYGCRRDGYYWSQTIESPFKTSVSKNTLT